MLTKTDNSCHDCYENVTNKNNNNKQNGKYFIFGIEIITDKQTNKLINKYITHMY